MNSAPPAWLTNIQAPVLPPIVYAPPPPITGFPYIPPNPSVLTANLPSQMLPSANTGLLAPQFATDVVNTSQPEHLSANDNSILQASDESQNLLSPAVIGIAQRLQAMNPIEETVPLKYIVLGILAVSFLLSRGR